MSLAVEILGAVVGLTGRDYLCGSDLLAAEIEWSPPAPPPPPKRPRLRRRRRRGRANSIERLIARLPEDVRERVIGDLNNLITPQLPVEALGAMSITDQNEYMDACPIDAPLDEVFGAKNAREEEQRQ